MRYGILHFYGVDAFFCGQFAINNHSIEFISVPSFAVDHITRQDIFQYWPDCKIFDVASLNCFESVNCQVIGSSFLNSTERLHVLSQSERMTFMSDLTIHERLLLIEQQERRCNWILEDSKVDHIAFGGIPHSVADYVLLLVAKKMGIGVSLHQDLPMVKGGHFIYDANFSIHTRLEVDETIQIQNSYKPKEHRRDKWADTYRFVNSQKSGSQVGILQHLLSDKAQNEDALQYYQKWQSYSVKLSQIDNIKSSVFIFLHVEPEATVNPVLGSTLPRQIDFIRLIRRCVDLSVPIYIKEHPAMFLAAWEDKQVNYDAYRGTQILNEINSIDNCMLLDAETRTDDLLDKQPICASIMGTIQSEALMKGCPLISSKSGPLEGAEGVFILDTTTPTSSLDLNLFNTYRLCLEAALASNVHYVSDLLSLKAFKGSPNAGLSMYYSFSEEELQKNNSCTAKTIIDISNRWASNEFIDP